MPTESLEIFSFWSVMAVLALSTVMIVEPTVTVTFPSSDACGKPVSALIVVSRACGWAKHGSGGPVPDAETGGEMLMMITSLAALAALLIDISELTLNGSFHPM